GLEEVKDVLSSGDYDLVILDEADMAVWFKLIPVEELTGLIDRKPAHVELIFTGRRADDQLIERADLVTEMREVKHYYQQGVLARKGIES
ncbi:MAG: cob(I)yrinic acid a,c-diamide adenosyltransferase, partial [Verrucomicrobia bacterium]|nr:cob(I)yrinic acid a,c-diamide adenosyltransferase [Verrucomicrobiota bacterium]